MDQTLVSYYAEKFAACDTEELGDLVARRADLSDEAGAGLAQALSAKGLRETDVYTPTQAPAPPTEEEAAERLAADTEQSRELWRGGLATASKIMVGLTFMAPVQALLHGARIRALWVGLLLLAAGYAGYWVGREITKSICADGEKSIEAKRKNLWALLLGLLCGFFVVYLISSALFGRA